MLDKIDKVFLTPFPLQVTEVRVAGRVVSREEYYVDSALKALVFHTPLPDGIEVIIECKSPTNE